jgi:hypothetical protein
MNQVGVEETGNPLQALTKLLFGADMSYQFTIFYSGKVGCELRA